MKKLEILASCALALTAFTPATSADDDEPPEVICDGLTCEASYEFTVPTGSGWTITELIKDGQGDPECEPCKDCHFGVGWSYYAAGGVAVVRSSPGNTVRVEESGAGDISFDAACGYEDAEAHKFVDTFHGTFYADAKCECLAP